MSPISERPDFAAIRTETYNQIGAIMSNPIRKLGTTCQICTTPVEAKYRRCYRCLEDRNLPFRVATRVVPLTYAIFGKQSNNDMHRYKAGSPEPQRNPSYQRIQALLVWFSLNHRRCIETRSRPISCVATVPSLSGRVGPHPLTQLAELLFIDNAHRIVLTPRLGILESDRRLVRRDHFMVADPAPLTGAHVALLEDTWVQGGHAQSAAASLFDAGADEVTIITIARRLDPQFSVTRSFLTSLGKREYDLDLCPVTGEECPACR